MKRNPCRLRMLRFTSVFALCLFSLHAMGENLDETSGTAVDNAYAAKLWQYLISNKLVGEGRIRSFPFVGSRPHGSIQEVITTEAVLDDQKGRLIVKHNYGAKEGLTTLSVYANDQATNYEALTIMFQREKGYDPSNGDWFWAEYKADGSIIRYKGVDLSGRSKLCLGCHTPLGGKDREILNGNAK